MPYATHKWVFFALTFFFFFLSVSAEYIINRLEIIAKRDMIILFGLYEKEVFSSPEPKAHKVSL